MNIRPLLLLVLVPLLAMTSSARPSNPHCVASSCGDISNISWPFRFKNDLKGCGDPKYELACEDNRTVLYLHDGRFFVHSINYSNFEIKLVDDGLQKNNCSSLPHHSGVSYYFRSHFDPRDVYYQYDLKALIIVNCSKPVSSPLYISTGSCIDGSLSSNASSNWSLYALVNPEASDVRDFCTISRSMWLSLSPEIGPYQRVNSSSYNYDRIHDIMADGFVLRYDSEAHFFWYCNFPPASIFFFTGHSMGQVCGFQYYYDDESK